MLVDTSVWVQHFRFGEPRLARLLADGQPFCHPFIIGELACGHLKHRTEILHRLDHLSQLPEASHNEVLIFVESHSLMGCGIGWVDAHLLAAAMIAATPIWTLDKKLRACAHRLGIFAEPQ